jgi:hypothetical protein
MSRKRVAALLLPGILLAACETDPSRMGFGATPVDGEWVGTQGGIVARFRRGNFTSRLADSSQVIARGTYVMVSGTQIRMEWQTAGARQSFSATCTLSGASVLNCEQEGGGNLVMQRAA